MAISFETLALAKKHANSTDGDYMTIDSALSDFSTNPVQNKVVKAAIDSASEPFIVTLTPTALDYSGTMDKTVAEIYEAYQAGKKIVFRLATSASTHIYVDVSLVGTDEDWVYPSFEGYVVQIGTNLFIWAGTNVTDDGTKATYSTKIFTLTPAT